MLGAISVSRLFATNKNAFNDSSISTHANKFRMRPEPKRIRTESQMHIGVLLTLDSFYYLPYQGLKVGPPTRCEQSFAICNLGCPNSAWKVFSSYMVSATGIIKRGNYLHGILGLSYGA